MSAHTEWVVPAEQSGKRIDRVLSRVLAEPRARSQQRLARGEVTVDGTRVSKGYRLRAGEQISVQPPAREPARRAPEAVPVRYQDEHVAVIGKPAGLVVHPGAGVHEATLVDALHAMGMSLASTTDPTRPGIVHRLDRGTSGLLVVAKSAPGLRGLAEQFNRHAVGRRYWAIVDRVPQPAQASIDAPIARHPTRRTRFQVHPDGRPARSHYEVTEDHERAAVLLVALETGRTHQVRVHLSSIGHPVSGDRLYGASKALAEELGLTRPALHAVHLQFRHPVTGDPIAVDEPLPPDLMAALARLRGAEHRCD